MTRTRTGVRHPNRSSVLINVNEILSFFDEIPDWADRHLCRSRRHDLRGPRRRNPGTCLHRNGDEHVAIRTEPVTTGRKKGPRLDRWIEADLDGGQKGLFQTEIKSVSAHSTGHKRIMLNASQEEMSDHEQENLGRPVELRKDTLRDQPMAKVLVPMKTPRDHREKGTPCRS